MSPLQRTMQYCREQGWIVGKTEFWNPYGRVRIDLFGFCDCQAITDHCVIAIQATTKANFSAREKKILANEAAKKWVKTYNKIYLFGWGKKKVKRGKKKEIWEARIQEITLKDFNNGL